MADRHEAGLWIGGSESPASDRRVFDVLDPGTAEVIGQAARGDVADVDRAVDVARDAFRKGPWRRMDPHQRGRLLWALARRVEAEKDRLARQLTLENGKPLWAAQGEVDVVVRYFEYYAGWADKVFGKVLPVPGRAMDYTLQEPLGVVGHIIPWNYPIDIFARGVAPCLAVGNVVVVKPDEQTPFGAIEIARLSKEVGFPDGIINVVTGLGEEAGAALAAHPGIQALAFCGSVATGKEVLAAAARRITPVVSLELGGKSASIVFADADVEQISESAARGICYNAGQSCGARSRLLVPRKHEQGVLEKTKAAMAGVRLGHGLENPEMGPLISQEQLDNVLARIEKAKKEGAKLLCGGRRADRKGFFIEPAVMCDARPGMSIVEEEVFGPVLTVMSYESEEEAIELANNTAYGLSAEVWTRDLSRAHRVAAALDVSHVSVNGTGGFGIESPFGGVKQSGFGREGGYEAILQYSRVKSVWIKL